MMVSDPSQFPVYRSEANLSLLEMVPPSVRSVLDVGCGSGENARLLHEAGRSVVGITLSAVEAAEARRWCSQVLVANVERDAIALEPESFDLILLSHVIEHWVHPTETLRRLATYLIPGGWAVIAVPNMAFWRVRWRMLKGDWHRDEGGWLDRTHMQFWSYATAPDLLSGTTLALKRHTGGSFAVPLWPLRRLAPSLSSRMDAAIGPKFPQAFAGQVQLLARKGPGQGRAEGR